MKKLLYGAGVAIGALTLFFVYRGMLERQQRQFDERYRVFTEETSAALRSMDRKRAPLPLLARASGHESNLEPSGDPANGSLPKSTESQAEGQQEDGAPRPEDQAAYVDSVFQTEMQDAAWARDTRMTIERLLLERVGKSRIESLECRKTICRARIAHQDEAQFQEFMTKAFSPPTLWAGAVMSMKGPDSPDGRVTNTMFFGRDQLELPRLD